MHSNASHDPKQGQPHADQDQSVRPIALPVSASQIPAELKALLQWVLWLYEWRRGKWTKPPINARTGAHADSTDPQTWTTFEQVWRAYQAGGFDGIGFALREDNRLIAIDLDHCSNPDSGEIDAWALEIIQAIGSYAEVSPSGTGIRILLRGRLPRGGRKKGDIEMYSSGRYVTITGCHLQDTPSTIEARQAEIEALHAHVFGAKAKSRADTGEAPDNGAGPRLNDDALLEKALTARNGGKLARLWSGDTRGYPSPSEADLALCVLLSFWTQDEAQLDRLFRRSGLFRDKWDEVHGDATYGQRTMRMALSQTRARWTAGKRSHAAQDQDADAASEHDQPEPDAADAESSDQEPTELSLPLSDQVNAEIFVQGQGRDLRHCHPFGQWFVFKKTHWKQDMTGEVILRAKLTVKRLARWIETLEDDEKAKAWLAHIKRSLSAPRLKAMVELAASEPGIPVLPDQLDADPWLLNCLNGTVDLRTGKLRPHRRQDLITKVCPVYYNPKARSELWESFLQRILPNEEVRDFVQRAVGYSSAGDTSEEKLFFAHGPTATGKSTILAAIGATLGSDYATMADFETFLTRDRHSGGPRNDIARLAGKRFVVSLEVDDGQHLAEALVKQLTGGDIVSARFLYHEAFEFIPTFKLWLAANHRPSVRDDDDALWRRILQVPFMAQIPEAERDPTVKACLRNPREAGAAILAWIVQGCLDWQHQGLKVPAAVKEATAEYRQQMDPLSGFIEDCCVTSATAKVRKNALWEAYQAWAKANDIRMLRRRQLTERLRQQGFDETSDGKVRWWIGLALLTDTSDASYSNSHKP